MLKAGIRSHLSTPGQPASVYVLFTYVYKNKFNIKQLTGGVKKVYENIMDRRFSPSLMHAKIYDVYFYFLSDIYHKFNVVD